MSLQLDLNILILQCCIPSALKFVLDLVIVTLIFTSIEQLQHRKTRRRQDSTERDGSAAGLMVHLPLLEVLQLVRREEKAHP